jgi:hypothetical protein
MQILISTKKTVDPSVNGFDKGSSIVVLKQENFLNTQSYNNENKFWYDCWIELKFCWEILEVLFPINLKCHNNQKLERASNNTQYFLNFHCWFKIFFFFVYDSFIIFLGLFRLFF